MCRSWVGTPLPFSNHITSLAVILPSFGVSNPHRAFKNVDFPLPEGPISVVIPSRKVPWAFTVKVPRSMTMSKEIIVPPYRFEKREPLVRP